MVDNITPWEVKGKVNYLDQIQKFGTNPIDGELIKRWERVTGTKVHHFIRRGLVFSHQDLNLILDDVESNKPVYIYTGRGPSSESMHLGHLVPFLFTKYLQDALNCIAIIQMSDDEKFFFKEGSKAEDLKKYNDLSRKNARDIIACGFDPKKTFIFSNLEFNIRDLYFNNVLIMKATNMNQIKGTYGLGEVIDQSVIDLCKSALETETDKTKITAYEKLIKSGDKSNNVGQCVWPCFQCGPAYCTSFSEIFINAIKQELTIDLPLPIKNNYKNILKDLIKRKGNIRCLVPMAIDQAPYFRMARDIAGILNCPKPAVIHSEFLPGLKQDNSKMSSTNDIGTLFLDLKSKQIEQTIKKYAFSGGKDTLEEHRKYGGDIKIDICYKYLTYFLESDVELKRIATEYTNGTMTSGELKTLTSKLIVEIISNHQKEKEKVTKEIIDMFFDSTRTLELGGCYHRNKLNNDDEDYDINFDRTFGFN